SGKDVIAQTAEQAALHVKIGREKLADKKFDAAASEFEEALRLDPANKEARRLKVQAEAEPQNRETAQKVGVKAGLVSTRVDFDQVVKLYGKITPESVFRPQAGQKLSGKLVTFAQDQCRAKKW